MRLVAQSRGSRGRQFDFESLPSYSLALETSLKFSTSEMNKKNNSLPKVVVKIKRVDVSEALRRKPDTRGRCYSNATHDYFI